MQIDLPEYAEDLFTPKRYKVFYGGRGGAKSETFGRALLAKGMNAPLRILCARELQVSINDSVHKLLSDIIAQHPGMAAFYEIQAKSIIGKNGTEFIFKGLKHNIQEIKSMSGVNICWVEEAQAVSHRSWETLIPTIREPGSEIWLSFNPKNATDPTWTRFVMHADDDMIVRKVDWKDNPFFPDVLNKERMKLLNTDPEAYQHVWEGQFDTRYSGSVYAKFVQHDRISDRVKYDPAYPVYTAWDKGYGDATAIVFYQTGKNEVFVIDYYENNQEDVKHYCEILHGKEIIVDQRDLETGEVISWHFGDDLPDHAHRQRYSYHAHYVPHDAVNKYAEAGGRSFMDQARKFGIRMTLVPATAHAHSEEALRATLPFCWINKDACADLVQSLLTYHYEYDEDRGRYGKLPYHDWSSNACDAAEIMARMWRDSAKPLTEKHLEHVRLHAKFHSLRREHKLDPEDPYRLRGKKRR